MEKKLQSMANEAVFGTGSEGGRRPTGDPLPNADTEVVVEAKKRRRYTKAYKFGVLEKVADLKKTNPGELGEYFRSEGLYYGTVRKWRSLQLEGSLCEHRKGSVGHVRETLAAENTKLKRQLEAMNKRLQQTELLVELQKKSLSIDFDNFSKGNFRRKLGELIMEYQDRIPLSRMCDALNYPRASYHRAIKLKEKRLSRPKRVSPRKLSDTEEKTILEILNSPRFCDMAPSEIYATLLDEGRYYCSIRTMYRILARHGQCIQRRQKEPGNYSKPELLATKPDEI